jgi:tRNA-dihydrouridine synthase B
MQFTDHQLLLAPLAGITEPVFRTLCRRHGADIVVSEMVSSDGVFFNARNTQELTSFEPIERPIGIQIFGSDPEHMVHAARWVEEHSRPDFIDINSGCPVPKVIRKNGGAALMKNPALFAEIVAKVVKAVRIPVTVKIRSGWDREHLVDVEFARMAQDGGAAAITLHPRTKTMAFGGHAMWERIGLVKQAVSIPVIGNGDIVTPQDGVEMLRQTGCDAIMIGRGSLGNPWIFEQIKDLLANRPIRPVTGQMKYALTREHIQTFRELHGETLASRELKKHLAWYIKNMPAAAGLRRRFFECHATAEFEKILEEYFFLHTSPQEID